MLNHDWLKMEAKEPFLPEKYLNPTIENEIEESEEMPPPQPKKIRRKLKGKPLNQTTLNTCFGKRGHWEKMDPTEIAVAGSPDHQAKDEEIWQEAIKDLKLD